MKIPMMPKGVEHPNGEWGSDVWPEVKIPMMPKGVEHIDHRPKVTMVRM